MGARRARSGAGVAAAAPRLLLSEAGQAGPASPARVEVGGVPGPAGLEARQEISMARAIRAHGLACGQSTADIALIIHSQCGPAFGTTLIRAHRLALGIALADVVAQVRARYVNEGRTAPRFSETLLSSYEGGQKRPGPEYLHYLCCVYQSEPADLGYEGPCLCGQRHRAPVLMLSSPAASRRPAQPPRRNLPEPAARPGTAARQAPAVPRRRYSPRSPARARPVRPGPVRPGPARIVAGPIGLTPTQLPAAGPRPGRPPGPPGPRCPGQPPLFRRRCGPRPRWPAWRCLLPAPPPWRRRPLPPLPGSIPPS